MSALSNRWEHHVRSWIGALTKDFYHPLGVLEVCGFYTDERLSVQEAMQKQWPVWETDKPLNDSFRYTWLRTQVVLPEAAQNERIIFRLGIRLEATLFVNGQSFGTCRPVSGPSQVNEGHHFYEDNYLCTNGEPNAVYDILAEVYTPPIHFGGDSHETGQLFPDIPRDDWMQKPDRRLYKSDFGIWNEDAYQLWMDLKTLFDLLCNLEDHSLRAHQIAKGLKQFVCTVDLETPYEERRKAYREARKQLAPLLEAHNGTTSPAFTAIGNSHLDLAWLWRISESERKTSRTFAMQLRHLEAYPDYYFFQSQPASYEMCKRYYPELYRRVQQAVREGRWIAEGGTWVEPDINLSGGESLIRQFYYGKKYLKDEFDVESCLFWIPDSFGYPSSLPQILVGCGIPYMMTAKILWNYNGHQTFEKQFFKWRGNDGSEVIVHIPSTYVCGTNPSAIRNLWKYRTQKTDMDSYLLPFGYGDGGGGPCRDHIEGVMRLRDLEDVPRVKMESPVDFFRRHSQDELPIYAQELYFAAHEGTYTAGAKVKAMNRKLEFALRDAELWGVLAAACSDFTYPYAQMDETWKSMLLQQFHDILPGSSIQAVYDDTQKAHEVIEQETAALSSAARQALTAGTDVTVFNSLGWEREAIVRLPERFAQGAMDSQMRQVPTIVCEDGSVLARVALPSCGWISLHPSNGNAGQYPVTIQVENDGFVLENQWLRVVIDANGEVTSLVLRSTNQEFAAGSMNRLHLYRDQPQRFDVWDIHESYRDMEVPLDAPSEVTVLCENDMEAALLVRRKVGNSAFSQVIRLQSCSKTLEFDTTIQWNEYHRFLKVSFPSTIRTNEMLNEIQYGYVTRPTRRSTLREQDRPEVCSHRYAALREENSGIGILNDSKYGVSVEDGEISLSLLRAPVSPEIGLDNGEQHFRYGITVWQGSLADSGISREAYQFQLTPQVSAGTGSFTMFSVEQPTILLDTVKPAADQSGDVILRLYESLGCSCAANIRVHLPVDAAWVCDMLENNAACLPTEKHCIQIHFSPFQVRTIRLRLTAAAKKNGI